MLGLVHFDIHGFHLSSYLFSAFVSSGPRLKLQRNSANPAADDFIGLIDFTGEDAGGNETRYANIVAQIASPVAGGEGGKFIIEVATHDAEMQTGFEIIDGNAEDELDVNIGSGTSSVTTIAGTLVSTGKITAGAGIAIGGTGAANTLDDYEEGSFNLTMVGSNGNPDNAQTLSSQYVKVGKLVSFRSFGTLNNTGAAGQISFSGLPFAPTGVCIVNIECNKQGTFSLSPYGYISGTVIYIQQMRSETTYIAINHNTATSGEWSITGCFHTNS